MTSAVGILQVGSEDSTGDARRGHLHWRDPNDPGGLVFGGSGKRTRQQGWWQVSVTSWAPYMEWAKKRPQARWDLAGSNLVGCTVDDLPGCREVIELNGLNPDGYPPLLAAIAVRYGVAVDRVVTASGAGGANFLAIASLIRPGDDVLVEWPTYDPPVGAARLMGANIVTFERRFEEAWVIDPERVRAALTPRTRLILLSSPHNPSGVLSSAAVLREVGDLAKRVGARVLVDEVYLDGVYGERPPPAATLGDGFVSTNSLTKAWGLSGLRAGWILADPQAAESMRRARDAMDGVGPIPTDRLAWLAFAHLDRLRERARSILEPNLQLLESFVRARADLEWVRPTGGNVAFPRVRGLPDTADFARRLQVDYDTAIVPGHFFGAPGHFRIAFSCERGTLEGGLDRLGRALDAGV
jgi:aspartate/methionine/tyrosine aminotransferase